MGKATQSGGKRKTSSSRPALNPDSRENYLISLASDLAEKQLREGTASSQVITHYLKLGSAKARLEKQILEQQVELIKAKTNAYKAAEHTDEMYTKAIEAMRSYGGEDSSDVEDSGIY